MCRNDVAIRRYWQEGVDNDKFHSHDGSGRPRATSDRKDRLIARLAFTVPDSSLSTIRRATRTRVSTMTIHSEIFARTDRNTPTTHACTLSKKRADPAFTIELLTCQHLGVMVWCAITFDRRPPVFVIRGTLTAQQYVDDILRTVLLLFLLQHPDLIFQQDNVIPHTAHVAMNYPTACQTLSRPVRSPDLSPIEHVWDMI
ncbi:transposable element Tcb2 transposase [Trichonephila clavipes]|nr:transposable element Tcb2 transposase [Trichonephila clavipes]